MVSLGLARIFETSNPPLVTHLLLKAIPPNPSQTVLPAGNQTFKYMSLWGQSHSNTTHDLLTSWPRALEMIRAILT